MKGRSKIQTDPVTRYAESVLNGAIPSCKWVRLACERHFRDIKAGKFFFDAQAAEHAIGFYRKLRHYKGQLAGSSFELATFQEFIIGSLYGWKVRPGGVRRFVYAYVEIPRKQGKTTLSGGVGLMGILEESGAEVYSVATKEDQAKLSWKDGRTMIKRSQGLSELLTLRVKEIRFDAGDCFWKALGSDSESLDGLNPSVGIFDELHAWRDRNLWDVIDDAIGARAQPIIFQITTAGSDIRHICGEQRAHVCSILEGSKADDQYFGIIFTVDEGDDPHDPASWAKANPILGTGAKTIEYMEQQSARAKQIPGKFNAFVNKQLNIWTTQDVRWLSMDLWNANAGEPVTDAEIAGRQSIGGLDLAATTDICALVRLFPSEAGDILVPTFWLPEDSMRERVKRDRVPYDVWARQGLIRLTPGNVVDYARVRADVNQMHEVTPFLELAYDPWNATQLATELQSDGIPMVPYRQGYASMSPAAKEFEKGLLGRRYRHGGHPVLKWMAGNVAIETDAAENIKPSKAKSREKIDGIVATVMAVGRRMVTNFKTKKSIYEERDPIVL